MKKVKMKKNMLLLKKIWYGIIYDDFKLFRIEGSMRNFKNYFTYIANQNTDQFL